MDRLSSIILAAGIIIAGGLLIWATVLKGELKTAREATQSAEQERDELQATVESYKATLEAIEATRRRESESISAFIAAKDKAVFEHEETEQNIEVLQNDVEACDWLSTPIPNSVCDIVDTIMSRPDNNRH